MNAEETAADWRARTWCTVERLQNEQPTELHVLEGTGTRRTPRRGRLSPATELPGTVS